MMRISCIMELFLEVSVILFLFTLFFQDIDFIHINLLEDLGIPHPKYGFVMDQKIVLADGPKIIVLDKNGGLIGAWNKKGRGPGESNGGLIFPVDGNIWMYDVLNGRINQYSLGLEFLKTTNLKNVTNYIIVYKGVVYWPQLQDKEIVINSMDLKLQNKYKPLKINGMINFKDNWYNLKLLDSTTVVCFEVVQKEENYSVHLVNFENGIVQLLKIKLKNFGYHSKAREDSFLEASIKGAPLLGNIASQRGTMYVFTEKILNFKKQKIELSLFKIHRKTGSFIEDLGDKYLLNSGLSEAVLMLDLDHGLTIQY